MSCFNIKMNTQTQQYIIYSFLFKSQHQSSLHDISFLFMEQLRVANIWLLFLFLDKIFFLHGFVIFLNYSFIFQLRVFFNSNFNMIQICTTYCRCYSINSLSFIQYDSFWLTCTHYFIGILKQQNNILQFLQYLLEQEFQKIKENYIYKSQPIYMNKKQNFLAIYKNKSNILLHIKFILITNISNMNKKNINYKSMQKTTQNKFNSMNKPPKPKPQWNMNFGDQEKYKLSNLQMIQKKVSLQSKNREQARLQLAQRRRKLQEGIVDQETRKIYQTAFLSKNIDLNPPLRRNLSQMINYQKQMFQQTKRSTSKRKSVDMSVNQQLKQTKQFIKKMEKAAKAKDITKAVEILQDKNSRSAKKEKNIVYYDKEEKMTPLQNVQQTVKFLQEKLFKKKNIETPQLTQMSKTNKTNIYENFEYGYSMEEPPKNNNEEIRQQQFFDFSKVSYNNKKHIKHDQSPIQQKKQQRQEEGQDDWLNTIKRMKKMIETKQKEFESSEKRYFEYQVDNTNSSKKNQINNRNKIKQSYDMNKIPMKQLSFQKQNKIDFENFEKQPKQSNHKFDDEIQFSLTINNDSLRIDTDQFFEPVIRKKKPENNISEITSIKKNKQLIQEMDPEDYQQSGGIDIYKNNFKMNKKSQIQEIKFMNQIVQPKKKKKNEFKNQTNSQVQKIRRLLDETKKNLDNLKVQTLQTPHVYNSKFINNNNCISLKKIIR